MAESKDLMNGRDEGRICNVTVQIVRNIELGGMAEDLGRLVRNVVKSQASRGEDLPQSFGTVHTGDTDSWAV